MVNNAELVLSFRPHSKDGLLEKACKTLPSSNLEFISVSTDNIDDINWVELFSCFTIVTTMMEAIGPGTSSLVRALTVPIDTNAGESTKVQPASTVAHVHAAIFPGLKFLRLNGLNFVKGDKPSGIQFDVFKRGLQQRMAASGEPLKLLDVSKCDISTEQANNLQKLVRDFHINLPGEDGRDWGSDGYDKFTDDDKDWW